MKKRIVKRACALHTKEGDVKFILSRSFYRRTMVISIDEKAQVTVYAPMYSTEKEICSFIRDKACWIMEKVEEANHNKQILKNKKFDHGQEFLFLGKKYKLEVLEKKVKRCQIQFDGKKWTASVPERLEHKQKESIIKNALVKWYRHQAKEVLGGRIFHFSRTLGVEPKTVAIRTQKQIWGSCDFNTQSINLNWQIILSPMNVIDYVVVHELCHLIVPNHSKRFWKKVEKIIPNFKEQKKWLRTNSLDMTLP